MPNGTHRGELTHLVGETGGGGGAEGAARGREAGEAKIRTGSWFAVLRVRKVAVLSVCELA